MCFGESFNCFYPHNGSQSGLNAVLDPIHFQCIDTKYWDIFQSIFCNALQEKIIISVWNAIRVSKWWYIFIFKCSYCHSERKWVLLCWSNCASILILCHYVFMQHFKLNHWPQQDVHTSRKATVRKSRMILIGIHWLNNFVCRYRYKYTVKKPWANYWGMSICQKAGEANPFIPFHLCVKQKQHHCNNVHHSAVCLLSVQFCLMIDPA